MEKILFVVNAEEFGGLEIVLLDWLSGIDYSKASVALCYRADALKEKVTAWKLPIESVKLTFPIHEPFWSGFQNWRRVFASIRPGKIVLLEGNIGDLGLAPILAARITVRDGASLFAGGGGFEESGGLHRHRQRFGRRLRSRMLRRTFVSSEGLKQNLVANGDSPERVSVLVHGVDIERFRPSPAERTDFRRAHGIPDDATVIVSHGRMARVKRVDRILKAFDALSAERENLWLLPTCYGPLAEEVTKMAAGSKARQRIKLVEFQEDASRILKAADIYVLASDREGFGIALIEAMATGLACVATTCLGPADILANGENGILVEASDEGVLAGLRQALSLGTEEKVRLAGRARKTVEERFERATAIRGALEAMGIPHR